MGIKFTDKLKVKKKLNLAILLNENFKKDNKYFKTFKDLKKKFNIYFFIIPFKKSKNFSYNKIYYINDLSKIKLLLKKLKFNFIIDGLYYADTKNKDKYYLSIIKKNHNRIDVLFNNAGIGMQEKTIDKISSIRLVPALIL